jgi:iron complex outermembrane receptor protein
MFPFRTQFLFLSILFLNNISLAQESDSSANKKINNDKSLQEIIIYSAEKKQQTQLKTPSSITYLGAEQIQLFRVWEINNLTGIAPNVTLSQSGDNRNIAGIRGIVTTSYDQAVATYIDGVAQFNLDTYIPQLNDIESIEILRGPQSTFYGRNSMGGVINIITKKPTNQPSLIADLSVGNYGQKRISAQLKSPIIKDKLYLSASILHDARNGYYTNDFTASTYDKQRQRIGALQLKYVMKNNWTIQADLKNYIALNNGAFPLNGDYTTALDKPYHLSQNQVTEMHDQTNNASIVLLHKGKDVNISFQSSYQNNYRYYGNTLDADFSEYEIIGIFNNYGKSYNNVKAFTNELKFQSSNQKNKKLAWTTGVYHFINSSPTKQATVFGKDAGFIGVPDKNFSIISYNHSNINGIAGYAHGTYQFNKKLSFQAGVRFDQEQRSLTVKSEYEKTPYPPFLILNDTTAKKNFSAFSPKLGLNYVIGDQQFIYLTYSRGFRSGGLSNISSDPSQLPLSAFLPEFSSMFELGLKGMNKVKTIQYTLAVIYNHVINIQTPFLVLPDAFTITKNAGILRSKGLEWEISAKPIRGLTLQYNAGFTNAIYDRYSTVINGMQMQLDKNKQIFTPNTTQFFNGTYQKKLGKNECWANLQYQFTGKQYFDVTNVIEQKAYGLIHAQIGIKISNINVYLWAKNITDKKYFSYGYDFGAVHLGNPRTVGIGISYKIL